METEASGAGDATTGRLTPYSLGKLIEWKQSPQLLQVQQNSILPTR